MGNVILPKAVQIHYYKFEIWIWLQFSFKMAEKNYFDIPVAEKIEFHYFTAKTHDNIRLHDAPNLSRMVMVLEHNLSQYINWEIFYDANADKDISERNDLGSLLPLRNWNLLLLTIILKTSF